MLGDGTGTGKGPGAGTSLVHPRHSKERGMEQRHRLGPGPCVWKILATGGEARTSSQNFPWSHGSTVQKQGFLAASY